MARDEGGIRGADLFGLVVNFSSFELLGPDNFTGELAVVVILVLRFKLECRKNRGGTTNCLVLVNNKSRSYCYC